MGQSQLFPNLTFLVLVEFSWPEKFSLKYLDNLKTLWFIRCHLMDFGCHLMDFGERGVRFLPENLENHYNKNSITQRFLPVVWCPRKPWSIEMPSDTHLRQRYVPLCEIKKHNGLYLTACCVTPRNNNRTI